MTAPVQTRQSIGGGEGGSVLTAAAIADLVGGRLVGDPTVAIRTVAPLDRAGADDLSFFASAKYTSLFEGSSAGVVLVSPDLADAPGSVLARVVVDRPHEALLAVVPRLYRAPFREPGVHRTVSIGRDAAIGARVSIGANVAIGDGAMIGDDVVIDPNTTIGAGVRIGNQSHIHPNVTLYSGTTVGERVIVQAGARVGSDGFGYVHRAGAHQRIPHIGRCLVHDDVEIGANSTIDRGSIDDTVIGAGTKIDNLVHVAHNVRIGKVCLIMAHVGISGSARVEDGCILAGQAGVAGHITIGKGATVGGQAGVFGNVPAGETWTGYPARPHRDSLRASAALFKLVPYVARIERFFSNQDRDNTE